MTCIVGIVEDGETWMGCDTLRSSGSSKVSTDTKIVKKDEMIFGFSGRVRDIQLIRFGFTVPKHEESISDYEYMATVLSTAVRKRLKEFGASKVKDGEENGGFSALIGYRGRLYKLDYDFCIMRIEGDYYATGSGMYHALGSLYSTEGTNTEPHERILLALEAAEHFMQNVGGPFIIESL